MASNYVQLNWLEPSWDDDQVGTLSSLERRQRKAAEKQDVNAFYSTLGFLIVIMLVLLVWSELSAEISLTVAFLRELCNSAKLVYQQLRVLYDYAKEVGLTCLAVVYGPDYQQRGITEIARGAAKLLARGLFYLSFLLSGLLMCSTYRYVAQAPLRTAAYTTLAAGALFGAPPLYALVVSHLCEHCSPQTVVLLAFLVAAVMCLSTYRMACRISRRLCGRKGHPGSSVRPRNQSASGRRPTAGAAGVGSGSVGSGASTSSLALAKDGGGTGAAGQKRSGAGGGVAAAPAAAAGPASSRTYSRASSSSNRGATPGASGDGSNAASLDPTRPTSGVGRSGSSSSFAGVGPSTGVPAGHAGAAGGSNGVDPTRPPSRASGGLGSAGSSSADLCTTASGGPQSKPGTGLTSAGHSNLNTSTTLPYDPLAPSRSGGASKGGGGAGAARGLGPSSSFSSSSSSTVHIPSGGAHSSSSSSSSSAAKNSAASSASKQQQRHCSSGSIDSAGGGSSKGGKGAGSATAAASQPSSRSGPVDPSANSATSSGNTSKLLQAAAARSASSAGGGPVAAADPVALTTASKKKGAAAGSGSATGPAAASVSGAGNTTGATALASCLPTNASLPRPAASGTSGASGSPAAPPVAKARAESSGGPKNGVTVFVSAAAPGASSASSGAAVGKAGASPAPASSSPAPPLTTSPGGLLSRLTSTVAPALAGRGVKKASTATATTTRKPAGPAVQPQQPQPTLTQQPYHTQAQLPPPSSPSHYSIVPPPPPPPRKSPTAAAATAAATSTPADAHEPRAAQNPWLNPNPVIKIAAGVAKGPKGSAAGRQTTHTLPANLAVPAHSSPAAVHQHAGTSDAAPLPPPFPPLASRSGGGALPSSATSPHAPSSARSASCGGGLSPLHSAAAAADHPLLSSRSSGATATAFLTTSCSSPCAPNTDPVALPPPLGSPASAAVGEPPGCGGIALGIPAPGLPPFAHGHPHQSHLSLHPQLPRPHLGSSGGAGMGAGVGAGEHLVSATIVTTDPAIGPLVAHKHASGDLDIASVAADYRPYASSSYTSSYSTAQLPPGTAVAAIVTAATTIAGGDLDSDSFSFFSTPPPVVISDPSATAADAAGVAAMNAAAGVFRDVDAAPGSGAPPMMYGTYGGSAGGAGGANFASLSSFAADPVWSPNLPVPGVIFTPAANASGAGGATAAAAAGGPRVPPPGFPSHAYGGAFAAGPLPSGGWPQPHPPPASPPAAAAPPADALPLPPAGERGSLASLGFVEDSGDASSVGGGDEGAGGSCTICWSAPRQVGFLHGKTSHLCVCRRCAAQLREGVHRCPMCRQLIERIIDIF